MHLNEILVLAQATAPAAASSGTPPPQGSIVGMLFPMALILIVMYFMMIRPQNLQRKKQAELLAALKSGDKVVTSSGIIGTVITVKDSTVSIRSADAKMEVTKASVVQILADDAVTVS